jgi:hypothetical protein
VDSPGSGWRQVAGCYEDDKKTSGCVIGRWLFWPAEELLMYQEGWVSHFASSLTSGRAVNVHTRSLTESCQLSPSQMHVTFNIHIRCALMCR